MSHNLVFMHSKLMELLEAKTDQTPYVAGLIAEVKDDPLRPPLVALLSHYGLGGRFHNLDILAGENPEKSPSELWDEVESVARTHPDVSAALDKAFENPTEALFSHATTLQNEAIAESIDRIWEMVSRCGMNGLLGTKGKAFGFEVAKSSVGRQRQ